MKGDAPKTKCGEILLAGRKHTRSPELLLRSWKAGLPTSCSKCMVNYGSKVNFQQQMSVRRGRLGSVFFFLS